MVKKIKTCVFISGNGSNLNSLIKYSRDYSFPIKIELIITNNKKAKGLNFAKKYNIPFKFFSYGNKKNVKKIKKIFSKEYKPYEIGYVSKEKSKIKIFGKLQW